jgi:flagellar motor switch/type III secretory pathway protein FliN
VTTLAPPPIRPFPWRSLDAITRAEANAVRDVKRWAIDHVRIDAFATALGDLLGEKIDLRIGRARPLAAERSISESVGILIAAQDADIEHTAILEAEPALAANLVARALRRPVPSLVKPGGGLSPAVAGALSAVILAAARRAHRGIAIRVLGVGPAGGLSEDFSRNAPELWAISLTVLVAHEAFAARVIVSRRGTLNSRAPLWDVRALAGLGLTPLSVPIVACAVQATPAEVAMLEPGDAMIPMPRGAWPLAKGMPLVGPVLLAPPMSDIGLSARLAEDGSLVLRGTLEPLVAAEAHMDSQKRDAFVASLGEVPVVVRVEIGEAMMAARDWASLGGGDLVALGRRVGEPVLLRVGGIPVARGELVDLDGEVAVRIVERLGDGTTP